MNQFTLESALRFSLFVRLLLRALCICCAIVAFVAIFQFVSGIGVIIKAQKETLIMSSSELGKLYGQCVDGPIAMTVVFAFLALALWRYSGILRQVPASAGTASNTDRVKSLLSKVGRVLSFLFLAVFTSFIVQLALGAYAIINVQDAPAGHSLAGTDYVHQLYLWLPAGGAVIFAAAATVFAKMGRLWHGQLHLGPVQVSTSGQD
jgi:hypothetical protein